LPTPLGELECNKALDSFVVSSFGPSIWIQMFMHRDFTTLEEIKPTCFSVIIGHA
jgi:hypothetical protein